MNFTDGQTYQFSLNCYIEMLKFQWGMDRKVFHREYAGIIREMIYEPKIKKDIIDRTVENAAIEIRKKAMPILMQKLNETMEHGTGEQTQAPVTKNGKDIPVN